ncbi:hypothetical protein ACN3E9_01385 [Vibrio pectenicida]|uniref:hypothetical protein n=1 Tax=Vibrio pectenicida TaxID=62763 RepID=UPI003B9B0E54
MKLTKLSVLFSSLYFGLVGSGYSSPVTMTFSETVDSTCGLVVDGGTSGSILFKGEAASAENFVTFTPYSNSSTAQDLELTLTSLGSTNLKVTATSGTAAEIGDDLKLWIGAATSAQTNADFGHGRAKAQGDTYSVSHAEALSAIATVNHKKSEIEHTGSDSIVTATISLACK